jgi:thymidylate synthase (FAD)
MGHILVPAAEEILDKEFRVLDRGFVRLVDYMGSDQRIVQAARVSYGPGTKTFREDSGLINYLLRNEHTSPFEQVVLTFHLKMPIFVARQLVRHRTARMNEISGRYSVMKDEFFVPEGEDVAFQSADNKQGRSSDHVPETVRDEVREAVMQGEQSSYQIYKRLVDLGIAKELCRIVLPLSIYTEMYWQMDLHNLFHFIRLRMHPHAQKEIRDYAEVMFRITGAVCPAACEAFSNHVLGSVRLSGKERGAVRALLDGKELPLSGREKELFLEKFQGAGG